LFLEHNSVLPGAPFAQQSPHAKVRAVKRSPFLAVIPAALAVALAGVRYLVQGSGNTWTKLEMRFYIPDPDTSYHVIRTDVIWLGLEAIGVLVGIAVGLTAAGWVIRMLERRRADDKRWIVPRVGRIATWVVGVGALAVPIAAFASGGAPDGATTERPRTGIAKPPTEGFDGGLALPAGTYRVAGTGSALSAEITAGHETFDARFERDITGSWQGAPEHLDQPFTASFSVAAAVVDTGVDKRSEHARDEYLYAGKHPRIGFELQKILATRLDGAELVFRATGAIALMGAVIPAEVIGKAKVPDAAARTRFGLGSEPAFVVEAETEFSIKASPLKADADSFDVDRVPIHVVLVLAKTE
jgi:hypothetical protein